MTDEVLTKGDFRGRRSTKGKTQKRQTHAFDDEKDIKGGRRGHSRMCEEEFDQYDDLEEFDSSIDWKKVLKN